MLENGSSKDLEQVRVELHNDELIVRRDANRKGTSRPVKNVSLFTSFCIIDKLPPSVVLCCVALMNSLFMKMYTCIFK